jgi:hypothetical protein
MRFDDMRTDYIDRAPKANIWAGAIVPPPPRHELTRPLRRAFEVPDALPAEWERLLARIR